MRRILPPTLLLLCLAAMLLLRWLWPLATLISPPFNGLGLAPLLLGLWLSGAASRHFGAVQTNINTFDEPGQLVTTGLFRYSRNPMYLGFVLIALGGGLLLGSLSPLLLAVAFAILTDRWYIAYEEQAMRVKFGTAYEAYARQVRRWL